jgi:hypothetical protein
MTVSQGRFSIIFRNQKSEVRDQTRLFSLWRRIGRRTRRFVAVEGGHSHGFLKDITSALSRAATDIADASDPWHLLSDL